ncbi:MAG: hypothetical protein ACW99E_22705 [Promethearchaeota archaeon]
MVRKKQLPRFPFDYIDEKAVEYDNSISMERNQKKTTLLSIEYLFDIFLIASCKIMRRMRSKWEIHF